jgi:hypothetical protein
MIPLGTSCLMKTPQEAAEVSRGASALRAVVAGLAGYFRSGLCPDAPSRGVSELISGAAEASRVKALRSASVAGLAGYFRSGLCPDAPSRGPNPARSFAGASV